MAVIAGNWKMHHGPGATRAFFSSLVLPANAGAHELLVFPTSLSLAAAVAAPGRDPRVQLGVQNIHWEDKGAFTGEVSAAMAARSRRGASSSSATPSAATCSARPTRRCRARSRAAQRHGLVPVVCVGETLDERGPGRVEEVILRQLDAALPALDRARGSLPARVRARVGHRHRRDGHARTTRLPPTGPCAPAWTSALGPSRSTRVPILYGGSVKPDNARELLAARDVDGVLVGGASLDAGSFAALVEAAG